ncbi:diguanylate cyclase (GGDEF)-like protein [Thermosipho japonicus]|uniref:Diguanylate cyclase (GGDEF)-like protein n=1 Tax=Thermosipho japonicus TaxID=90323 RepID=A0A841GTC6_9BACT|nr:diguanylate cyclase [Thermosipho japonicus]MBB6062550.1 diguanylate cyclase (GGDEF)-like protein [Thermosipho japonicus]
MERITFLICENFRKEFETVSKKLNEKIDIITFPSFCTLKKENRNYKIKEKLLESKNLVIFCCKFCDILKKIPEKYLNQIKLYKFENCFYMFGKTNIDKYLSKGAYLVTPGWLVRWKENLSSYGFDKETAQSFFKEITNKIVLLNTKVEKNIETILKDFSNFLELPYTIEDIGLDYFELLINKILAEIKAEKKIKELTIEKSNYMAAFNILSRISSSKIEKEDELISIIVDQIKILLSPEIIEYFPFEGNDILKGDEYKINNNIEIIVKIKYNNEIYGFLKVGKFLFHQYFDSYVNFLVTIKDVLGLAISNVRKIEKILNLAITDALTGIYNKNYFELKLSEEINRCKREGKTFSLIMFDLDNFKGINDKYGHHFGDKVLIKVAEKVQKRLRKTDFFFRWGGDEFLIILPNTNLENAEKLSKELKKIINEIKIKNEKLKASFGVVSYNGKDDPEATFKKVDEVLYKAKQSGKDRICVYK